MLLNRDMSSWICHLVDDLHENMRQGSNLRVVFELRRQGPNWAGCAQNTRSSESVASLRGRLSAP